MPDPLALDPTQNNLLLLDDCCLGKQNKAETYYTRGRHNNLRYDIHYRTDYLDTIRENSNFIILFPQDAKHNFITIDLKSTPMDGKYRQNFNRFYFPTGTIYSRQYIHIVSHHGSIQVSHLGSVRGSVHHYRITIIQRCCTVKLQESSMHCVIRTK